MFAYWLEVQLTFNVKPQMKATTFSEKLAYWSQRNPIKCGDMLLTFEHDVS